MAVKLYWFLVAFVLMFVMVATVCDAIKKPVGTTPLVRAIRNSDVDKVRALLREGASPNERSPLFILQSKSRAKRKWRTEDVSPVNIAVQCALSREWDEEHRPKEVDSAYLDKSLQILAMVCDAGASLGARRQEILPLHDATLMEGYRTVQVLLDHGANPNQRDQDGQTALHRLAGQESFRSDRKKCFHMKSRSRKAMQILLRNGGLVDARDQYGRTPFYHASRIGNVTACLVLLAFGADPNAKDIGGMAPIDVAFNQEIEDLITGRVRMADDPDR